VPISFFDERFKSLIEETTKFLKYWSKLGFSCCSELGLENNDGWCA
jgi:hypothetical protein